MTLIVPMRLNADEHSWLMEMTYGSETGAECVADFMRLLLHREWKRRKGLPKPKPSDWQGVYRVGGRPKKQISAGTVPAKDTKQSRKAQRKT